MPWPQLPSGDDIMNDILMFFKICLGLAVAAVVFSIVKVTWFDKTDLGKSLIQKEKEKQVEQQKEDVKRAERELERLKKAAGQ